MDAAWQNGHAIILGKPFIPTTALAIGTLLIIFGGNCPAWKVAELGKLVVYFGAQTGMNLYMKDVLSNSVVESPQTALSEGVLLHHNLQGMPAAFAITAIQQFMAFVLFGIFLAVTHYTSFRYSPKRLTTSREFFAVCLFSLSFILNIALNNYSLSLIPLSVNLIIRSCLPLSTFLSQQVSSRVTGQTVSCHCLEIVLMTLGVMCAGIAVVSANHGVASGSSNGHLIYGVIVCILSLLSGSLNLALAGVLGTSVHLNALDTTVYMAIPATIILLPFVFLWQHPVGTQEWELVMGATQMTDWEVVKKVAELSPRTIYLTLLSGVFALAYNVLQYAIVQTLSATHTAFAGNFNKAATITLALMLGMEHLPPGGWGAVMLIAVLGNIGSFTGYSMVQIWHRSQDTGLKCKGQELLGHGHGHGHGGQCSPIDEGTAEEDEEGSSGSEMDSSRNFYCMPRR